MFKRIATIITVFTLGLFVTAAAANAAVSVRLQEKTSSNTNTFNLTFVGLDTDGGALTVKCFKGTPPTGTEFQEINLVPTGGDTGNCQVNSSVVPTEGSYSFYVTATNGSQTATSNVVTVEVKTSNPGTPINYGKDKITACEYKIHFRSADDGGKTVKVEVYRSENKSFNADAATRVASIGIGSNSDHDFVQSVPDCNKTYYYAVRAFDSAGNGSGITGDSETVVTTNTINPTTTTQQSGGAIPVGSNANAQSGVQGTETGGEAGVSPTGEETQSDIDTASVDEEKGVQGASDSNAASAMNIFYGIAGVVILALIVYWFIRRRSAK